MRRYSRMASAADFDMRIKKSHRRARRLDSELPERASAIVRKCDETFEVDPAEQPAPSRSTSRRAFRTSADLDRDLPAVGGIWAESTDDDRSLTPSQNC